MLRNKVTRSQMQIMGFIRREVNRTIKYDKFPGYVTSELLESAEFKRQQVPSDLEDKDQLWTLISLGLATGAYNRIDE